MSKRKRKTTARGWCWDCEKDVDQKIVIPTCAKNPTGLKGPPHGNDGTCSDEYCRVSDFGEKEYKGELRLSKYKDYYYRCPDCDTLNVEHNGHGRPKKKKLVKTV